MASSPCAMLFHVNSHTVLGFVELNSAKRLLDNIYRWDGYCSRLGFLSKQASGIVFAHNFKIQNFLILMIKLNYIVNRTHSQCLHHVKLAPARLKTRLTRGHEYKIHKQFCRTNSRKFTFSQRIINDWNSLPSSVAHSKDVTRFKLGIDKFFEGHMWHIATT